MSGGTRQSPGQLGYDPNLIEIKSKFEFEFRRFTVNRQELTEYDKFSSLIRESHRLPDDMQFTVSYTDPRTKDHLPITNNDNLLKAFLTAMPFLRIIIYREREMMDEVIREQERKKKNKSLFAESAKKTSTTISAPKEFRKVGSIVDADLLPDTVRRVKLVKQSTDRPLGFYIRDGTSVRVTPYGLEKVPGIFISRLVPGGLAEGTGLLSVNDEIIEVNGIDTLGKSLDQVTDMMVANSQNLVITVKPSSLPPSTPRTNTLPRGKKGSSPPPRSSRSSSEIALTPVGKSNKQMRQSLSDLEGSLNGPSKDKVSNNNNKYDGYSEPPKRQSLQTVTS